MRYQPIKLETVANNVRMKRCEHRLTMEELGNKCEVSTWTINSIENCKNEPKLLTLAKIAEAVDCKLEDLLY